MSSQWADGNADPRTWGAGSQRGAGWARRAAWQAAGWPTGPGWAGERARPTNRRFGRDDGMRVSDAERTEVADDLKRHCADGRLDLAEFDQRLHLALTAKTRGDLAGLMADLPDLRHPAAAPTRRRPWLLRATMLTVAIVGSVSVALFVIAHLHWLAIALVVALIWRRGHHHSRRHGWRSAEWRLRSNRR